MNTPDYEQCERLAAAFERIAAALERLAKIEECRNLKENSGTFIDSKNYRP